MSPDLIVLPLLPLSEFESRAKFSHWTELLHTVVIGPGLGRDLDILKDFGFLLENISDKICVCDADFFWFYSQSSNSNKQILRRFQNVIFTPNFVEFTRLFKNVMGKEFNSETVDNFLESNEESSMDVIEFDLASHLPAVKEFYDSFENSGLCFVIKYKNDIIVTNNRCYLVKTQGSLKRCGGLGDILTGLIANFSQRAVATSIDMEYALLFASVVNRKACHEAYKKYQLGLVASDVLKYVPRIVNTYLEENSHEKIFEDVKTVDN